MTKEEIFEKWCELTNTYIEKEAKVEAVVYQWLNDEDSAMSKESVEHLIDSTIIKVGEIKTEADRLYEEYLNMRREQEFKKEVLKTTKQEFGVSPDDIVVTGGVLAPNAEDSHLIGRDKTHEEEERDRQMALAEIRRRAINNEISLSEASELTNKVNIAYGKSNQEMSSGMHK